MRGLKEVRKGDKMATQRHCEEHKLPYVVWPEDQGVIPPLPYLGEHKPEGWDLDKIFRGTPQMLQNHLVNGKGYAYIQVWGDVFVGEYTKR